MTGADLRAKARAGLWTGPTAGGAPGFVQANLVALPAIYAGAFEAFCRANPQACPLLEVTLPGDPHPAIAAEADLRTDLPRYHVYRSGELAAETGSVGELWAEDTVAFLIGCSFSFEYALISAGIELRHVLQARNVAMYRTSVACTAVDAFDARLVVSMRPLRRSRLEEATAICAGMPDAHGIPVAYGEPDQLGIGDLSKPDFGDPVRIEDDEVPVFWACGVTAIEAVRAAALPVVITHAPGHMFATDRLIAST